uniref:SCP domain-containing protein n=1 Tax=Mycena chlorophos TaxID=658473 RepID=A0ABQ0LRT3_MYCCL|nr:predicted protein [Mycena chlorophos]
MEADDVGCMARSEQRIERWGQEVAALRTGRREDTPHNANTVLDDEDEDVDMLDDERDEPMKVEPDSEDDEARRIKLDPQPLRNRKTLKAERKAKEVWYNNFRKTETLFLQAMDTAKMAQDEELERENGKLQAQLERLQEECAQAATRNAEADRDNGALAALQGKYQRVKADRKELRQNVSEQVNELAALRAKVDELQAAKLNLENGARSVRVQNRNATAALNKELNNLRQSKSDYKKAKQTQIATLEARYQALEKGNAELLMKHAAEITALKDELQTAKEELQTEKDELQREKDALQREKDALQTAASVSASEQALLKTSRARTPEVPCAHKLLIPQNNLFSFLSQNAASAGFINDVLFLPGRTLPCASNGYLAFAPAYSYDAGKKRWVAGSDFGTLYQTRRELFVVVGDEHISDKSRAVLMPMVIRYSPASAHLGMIPIRETPRIREELRMIVSAEWSRIARATTGALSSCIPGVSVVSAPWPLSSGIASSKSPRYKSRNVRPGAPAEVYSGATRSDQRISAGILQYKTQTCFLVLLSSQFSPFRPHSLDFNFLLQLIMLAYSFFALIAVTLVLARPLVERDGNGSDASDQDVKSYLNGHNSVRAAHGANPLQWNNTLASKAQTWANKCTNTHSGGTLGPFGGTGDYNISSAINNWVTDPTEEPAYNANAPVASHFTQIVWKASTQLGCAAQTCSHVKNFKHPNSHYYVCEFFPPGNVEGEFGRNVQVASSRSDRYRRSLNAHSFLCTAIEANNGSPAQKQAAWQEGRQLAPRDRRSELTHWQSINLIGLISRSSWAHELSARFEVEPNYAFWAPNLVTVAGSLCDQHTGRSSLPGGLLDPTSMSSSQPLAVRIHIGAERRGCAPHLNSFDLRTGPPRAGPPSSLFTLRLPLPNSSRTQVLVLVSTAFSKHRLPGLRDTDMQNQSPSPFAATNRQIMSDTIEFYISLLDVSANDGGPPSLFNEAFPMVDHALLVTQRGLVTREGGRVMDFTIQFKQHHRSLMWKILFGLSTFPFVIQLSLTKMVTDGDTTASFTIPASIGETLRDWSPSAIFVLSALRASLRQQPHECALSLTPRPFTISTLGRTPAHELSLRAPSGNVVVEVVLYRCVTRRCGRAFTPGSRCSKHDT